MFTQGAVSPEIEAVVVLVDVRSGFANTKTSQSDVGAVSMQTGFAGMTGLSGEHGARLVLSKGDGGLVGRKSHQCLSPSPMSYLWHNLPVVVRMQTVQCYNLEFSAGMAPLLRFF